MGYLLCALDRGIVTIILYASAGAHSTSINPEKIYWQKLLSFSNMWTLTFKAQLTPAFLTTINQRFGGS